MTTKEEKDLFQHYDLMPENLSKICEKWSEKEINHGLSYKDCEEFLKECELIGFTFEFGLSSEPYNLRKMTIEERLLHHLHHIPTENLTDEIIEGLKERKDKLTDLIISLDATGEYEEIVQQLEFSRGSMNNLIGIYERADRNLVGYPLLILRNARSANENMNWIKSYLSERAEEISEEQDRLDGLNETILGMVSDSVADLIYYDRKNCEQLKLEEIEESIVNGELSIQDLVDEFEDRLTDEIEKYKKRKSEEV